MNLENYDPFEPVHPIDGTCGDLDPASVDAVFEGGGPDMDDVVDTGPGVDCFGHGPALDGGLDRRQPEVDDGRWNWWGE